MVAAAGAARAAEPLVGSSTRALVTAYSLILGAGLVEGACVGLAQGFGLRRLVPRLPVRAFVGMTVLAAGVGWAAGSLPSLRSNDGPASAGPSLALLAVAGVCFGAVMGVFLGWCQRVVLRRATRHSGRWVMGSGVAWALAMAVLMVGASTPTADWPLIVVLAWAALTGALAGALLGAVLGWFAPSLDGTAPANRLVLALLRRGLPAPLTRSVVGIRLHGRNSGREIELPVMFAARGEDLVVAVGNARHKMWWRNLDPVGPVQLVGPFGAVTRARAQVLRPGEDRYAEAIRPTALAGPALALQPTRSSFVWHQTGAGNLSRKATRPAQHDDARLS
jgi:hypothetical protein